MNKDVLVIKDLTKKYKDGNKEVIALNKISFTLPKSYDLAILGPSGSGKTTLLQLAGGLDKATSGEVIINGKNINKMSDKDLSIFRNKTMGFIFQMINLQDYFTAQENIMLPMLIGGMKRKDALEKSMSLLELIGLTQRATHLPKELSGGEQQRVAVARALANDPQIIFADEPTGKLDKENSKMVIELLEKISHEKGTSVIMITHDETIAKRFSRVIKLSNGVIQN